jgi:hypothetical protein
VICLLNDNVLEKLCIKAQTVFLNPTTLYSYEDIVFGKYINDKNGNIAKDKMGRKNKMYAIATNTIRAFERIDKQSKVGPKYLLNEYLKSNKNYILNNLKQVQSKKELDDLEICISNELKKYLSRNVLEDRLKSFNRLRKPVDLLIEHLVCMAVELGEDRSRLLEYLFIPLDSQIFNSELLTNEQLHNAGVSSKSKFGELVLDKSYYYLQDIIFEKAFEISDKYKINFSMIYFDLLWGSRYNKWGGTLFETNIYDEEYDK